MVPMLSKKQWVLSHFFLVSALVLSLWAVLNTVHTKLRLSFLDIGQGDAILIQTPEYKNILIDAGPDSKVVDRLGEKMGFFDKTIDLFIMTHPDRDHYAGIMDIFGKYEIQTVMLTGIYNADILYREFLNELKQRDISIIYADNSRDLQIGRETYLDILYPFKSMSLIGKKVRNKNSTSVALRLVYKGKSLALLSGDAEEKQERELVLSGQEFVSDIFKLGHHGSKSSSSQLFLNAVTPKTVVISAGKDNKFGHPHEETLNRVKDLEIRSTITQGTVTYEF